MYVEGVAQDGLAERGCSGGSTPSTSTACSRPGDMEEYIVDSPRSPFPQLLHTERPDAFAIHLLDGRVGVLVDGLPLGFLLPAGARGLHARAGGQRRTTSLVASMLTLLRWVALALSLLPAGGLCGRARCTTRRCCPVKLLLSHDGGEAVRALRRGGGGHSHAALL